MANRRFNQFFNTLHKMPILLDCNFVVDSTSTSGITSLKGAGIQNVYMHTSGSPVAGNPNPASGIAIVQLQDNYNRYFGGFSSIFSPQSGSSILVASAGVVNHTAYVITIVGTTTAAGWQSLGLPVGITPAVGVSFIATATTTAAGTGAVQVPKVGGSGIVSIDVVGNPNTMLTSSAANVVGISSGAYMIVRFMGLSFAAGAYTPAGTISAGVVAVATGTAGDAVTNNAGVLNSVGGQDLAVNAQTFTGSAASLTGTASMIATAPADGSIVNLGFYLSNSNILVQGE